MSDYDFTLHRPGTVAEACELGLRIGRSAVYLAGGTDLLVDLRSNRKSFAHVISLTGVVGLDGIRQDGDRLTIGAMATLADIAASPLVRRFLPALAETISGMAGRQIRNLATMGGNFSCGVPCSDTPPIACAAGAEVTIAGADGDRTVPAREFFLGPRETALRPGEILREIHILPQPATSGAATERFTLRRGSALAVASVAAWLDVPQGKIANARVVLGAVGPVPIHADRTAERLRGGMPGPEVFADAGRIAAEESRPITDLRGSEWYRRDIVAVLTARALARAAARASGGAR